MYKNYTIKTGSIARDATMDIFIDEKLRAKLYDLWNNHKKKNIEWRHPISAQGGISILTCEMIIGVDFDELKKVYGVKDAKKLLEVANKHTLFTR